MIYQINRLAVKVIQNTLKYRVYMRKHKNIVPRIKNAMLNKIKYSIEEFQQHRKNMVAKEQEIPTDDHLEKLNGKIIEDFDKIVKDTKIFKKTAENLSLAEVREFI
jgi:hypothetical protein